MVALDSILSIFTFFLAFDTAVASHQTLVRRAVDSFHLEAARRTHSLAKDLRVAFDGIFPRAVSSSQPEHVVYCKPARQVPLSVGWSGGGEYNGTSSMSIIGTRTSTKNHPTSTGTSSSPSVTSPWKLISSYVRVPLSLIIAYLDPHLIFAEWVEFLRWMEFFHWCRSDKWFVPIFSVDRFTVHHSSDLGNVNYVDESTAVRLFIGFHSHNVLIVGS